MSFWFHQQGALRLLVRRKGPVARMILVALFGSIWCLAGAVLGVAVWRDLDRRAEDMTIDVVANTQGGDSALLSMLSDLRRRPSVLRAEYLAPDRVWKEFAAELRLDAQDLREVVATPSMLRIHLRASHATTTKTQVFVQTLRDTYPDACERVVWPRAYIEMIGAARRDIIGFGGAAGMLSVVLFLIGVAYAFRAEIQRAGTDLTVASLLGATPTWIAAPHIIVGVTAGFVGLGLGVAAIFIALGVAGPTAPWLFNVSAKEIMIAGGILGLLGIFMSVWQSIVAVHSAIRRR